MPLPPLQPDPGTPQLPDAVPKNCRYHYLHHSQTQATSWPPDAELMAMRHPSIHTDKEPWVVATGGISRQSSKAPVDHLVCPAAPPATSFRGMVFVLCPSHCTTLVAGSEAEAGLQDAVLFLKGMEAMRQVKGKEVPTLVMQ